MSDLETTTPSSTESERESREDVAEYLPAVLPRHGGGTNARGHFLALMRAVSRHCRRLVHCRAARIWVARRGATRLVAWEVPEDPQAAPTARRLAMDEGIAGWVFTHDRPLRIGPGSPAPEIPGPDGPVVSALALPFHRADGIFAVLECLEHEGAGFTQADQDRLEVAAEQIGFALDNALLYEQSERRALEKEVMLEVSNTLVAPLDLDEVLDTILRTLRQVVDYHGASIYLVNKKTLALELVRQIGFPEGAEEVFGLRVGVGVVGWVAKTGDPVIIPDVRRDTRYVTARPQTRSELAAPLQVEGRTIGVFNLESDVEDAFHQGHLEILSAFASQAAIAIERARLTRELLERRRLEKELAIAREIQASFLPKGAPELPGFDLAGTAISHDEVGGDYYDFIRVSDTRLGLAIADGSGKGIPAALIMAGFRMSLLAEIRNEFAIRAIMRKVNQLLHESIDRNKFVTAFYGLLDFRNRVLTFSNAGHNPPLLRRADGRVEYLLEGGVALGVLADAHYDERPIALRPGDVLVLYTDGVSEAESPSGEHFGQRRLEQAVDRLAERSAQAIVVGLVDAVTAWAGERGPSDDLTLVAVKVLPE